ncbi:MAG: M20 family metallo-hydrolase [Bacteroidetes bacterium]|nr:M20 family metallo-hydrolase [Bacteroidota bacterium]
MTRLDGAIALLSDLIRTPSFSREENGSADLLRDWLGRQGLQVRRTGNNIWTRSAAFDERKPTVMLCSHHDTVRPVSSWERDAFDPLIVDGKIIGLGSNDAGGCVAALCMTFLDMHEREDLPFNLLLVLSAEEEIAGDGGVASLGEELGAVDFAIVGEPTDMELAVAEKGLMVLDCTAHGVSGHAARSTGVNAISVAMKDIAWIEQYRFPRESPRLGPVKMTVTQIEAGTQHNVVPDHCHFVVDVRVTETYSHEEILEVLRANLQADVQPRSMRLRPSAISDDHAIIRAAESLGLVCFGSPTMSDQALLTVPSVKIGPGRSERSHTAGEYLMIEELERGLRIYHDLLERYAEILK